MTHISSIIIKETEKFDLKPLRVYDDIVKEKGIIAERELWEETWMNGLMAFKTLED